MMTRNRFALTVKKAMIAIALIALFLSLARYISYKRKNWDANELMAAYHFKMEAHYKSVESICDKNIKLFTSLRDGAQDPGSRSYLSSELDYWEKRKKQYIEDGVLHRTKGEEYQRKW